MNQKPKIASLPQPQTPRSRTKALKFFLMFTAVSSIVIVSLWPYMCKVLYSAPTQPFNLQEENQTNAAIAPFYQGRDQSGQLYIVKADKAIEVTPQSYKLINPFLSYHLNSGQEIQISAQHGFYDPQERKMYLVDKVRLQHSSGYDFTTARALIDIVTSTISGSDPVSGTSPTGNLKCVGFQVLNKGNRVILGQPTLRYRG